MCRSIKQLRPPLGKPSDSFYPTRLYPTPLPTDEDIRAAALQFVRKVSGYRNPSRGNQAAFDRAVEEITIVTAELLKALVTSSAHISSFIDEKLRQSNIGLQKSLFQSRIAYFALTQYTIHNTQFIWITISTTPFKANGC